MTHSPTLAAATALIWCAACGGEEEQPLPLPPNPAHTACGMTVGHYWRGSPTKGSFPSSWKGSLDELHQLGMRRLVFTPLGQMETRQSVQVKDWPYYPREALAARIRLEAQYARQLGMKLMIKPHVLVATGKWVANLDPDPASGGWAAWFTSYEAFITNHARLAQQIGADYFCAGVELRRSIYDQPQRWREMLARIRKEFSGKWTYTAHFEEVEQVTIWNSLDAVGVAMFAPLSQSSNPTQAELQDGAAQWLARFEKVAQKFRQPLLITEVGFANREGTAREPWEWPSNLVNPRRTAAGDAQQAQGYRAIISTFGHSDQVEAMFWWKWFDDLTYLETSVGVGFNPRGLPAARVLESECAASTP